MAGHDKSVMREGEMKNFSVDPESTVREGEMAVMQKSASDPKSVVREGELGCEGSCNKLDNFMLVHGFYNNNIPTSELYYQFIEPLLSHIKIKTLIRAKINLNQRKKL